MTERTSLTACNNRIERLPAYINKLQQPKRLTMYDNMLSRCHQSLESSAAFSTST